MEKSNVEPEFRICAKCGYQRGFHVYFRQIQEGKVRIGLICPSCGQSHDIGWVTPDIPGIEAEKGQVFEE